VASVALGEVGFVLGRELSRLARTDKDFCHLLEVCQVFGTLIADETQVYDLGMMDDLLVLGIKGTLSVVELKILKARLLDGQREKARRGELFRLLPGGYVLDADGKVAKDPDVRVQEAMALVFRKYRELWSVRQTFKWWKPPAAALILHPAAEDEPRHAKGARRPGSRMVLSLPHPMLGIRPIRLSVASFGMAPRIYGPCRRQTVCATA
jgi:resolvase-like protein